MSGAISEINIIGISPEDLEKTAALENNDKLHDISLFASAYGALLSDGSFDSDDYLSVLASEIENSDVFRNTNIICDKFSTFLASEIKVLLSLAKTGAELTVTIPSPTAKEPKYSLFSVISKGAMLLKAKANKIGLDFTVKTLDGEQSGRPEDLEAVRKHLYGDGVFDGTPENISIYKASNILDETDRTAAKIAEMVRDMGY
ncbi:MAG: hypothetical protein IJB44_00075, partial [Clostridia bacterium]|nr:hypothetical protein [Clostridia bacterium]